ncbi:MAG: SDR family oxidoreductase [Alistipes indistinctus]
MTTLEGRSPYSISKFYAESTVRRIALRGLRTVIVNPAIILGETDWNSGSGLLIKGADFVGRSRISSRSQRICRRTGCGSGDGVVGHFR